MNTNQFILPSWITALLGAMLYALASAMPAHAADYQYTAVTEAAAADKQGAVRAGSLTWQCSINRCTTSGPWSTPTVRACEGLAREVGRIRSYGHTASHLSADQIQQCNRVISGFKTVAPIPKMPTAPGVPTGKTRSAPGTGVVGVTPQPGIGIDANIGMYAEKRNSQQQQATNNQASASLALASIDTYAEMHNAPFHFDDVRHLKFMTVRASVSNPGPGIWGHPASINFQLYQGTPDTRMRVLSEGRSPRQRLEIPLPLRAGETRLIETKLRDVPGVKPGQWHTLVVYVNSGQDRESGDNTIQYVFMLDREGRVTSSRTERPASSRPTVTIQR